MDGSVRLSTNKALQEEIVERERAEASLRESENKYRNIFNNTTEGIFQTTPAGRVLTANPALARMLAYDSPEDFITSIKNLGTDLFVHPERRKEFLDLMSKQGFVRDFEYQAYRKDHQIIDVAINVNIVRDENRNFRCFEGVLRDVTQLKKYQEHMEMLVRERTAEITQTNEALQQEIAERKQMEKALVETNKAVTILNLLANTVCRLLDFDTVITEAARAMDTFVHGASIAVHILNTKENYLEQRFTSSPNKEASRITRKLPLEGSFTGLTIASKNVVISEDIINDERISPEIRQALNKGGWQSCLSLPLLFHDEVLGALNLFFTEKRIITESERETFLSIGKTIGMALANARYVDQIEKEIGERKQKEEELRTINMVADAVYDSLDLKTVAQKAAISMSQYTTSPLVAIFALNKEEECLEFLAHTGFPEESEKVGQRLPLKGSLSGLAVAKKEISWSSDFRDDNRMWQKVKEAEILDRNDMRMVISVPLLFKDEAIGVMNLIFKEYISLPDYKRETLLSIGKTIGLAMANAGQVEQIKKEVSERQRAEDALRESENKYRNIFNNTIDGIFQTSAEGRILTCNPALARILGYDSPEELMTSIKNLGRDLYAHAERRKEFVDLISKQGFVRDFEYQAYRKDHTIIDVAIRCDIIRDENNKPLYFEGVLRDITELKKYREHLEELVRERTTELTQTNDKLQEEITERRRAEEALRESENKYRNIFNNTSEGIFQTNPQGRILTANPALARMLAYDSPEDFITSIKNLGTDFYVLSERRKEFLAIMSKQGFVRDFEFQAYRKDRQIIDVVINVDIIRDENNKLLYFEGVLRDITELKKYQEHLEELVRERTGELMSANEKMQNEIHERERAENKFRDIFNNAMEGIFQSTPKGRIIMANPAMARIMGYNSPEELMESIVNLAHDFYVEPERRTEFLDLISSRGSVSNFEYRAYRKDRSIIVVSLNAHLVRSEAGEILYFEGVLEDITERKRIEEFKIAKEAAETATRTKSEFLANMSHEIRTPMNSILGFSGLALKTELSEKQRDYLVKIESSAKSLLSIINDILDFSKIEAGKLQMESENFQLNGVINSAADMFSFKTSEKGIELIVSVAEDVPNSLIGDPLRLGQILVNLVGNAVKFTESGHIYVKTALLDKDEKQCRLEFSITDTGIGMTKAQIAKLFQAFSQTDTSITRRFGGTGLGLAISKQLVEMMGGKISVKSKPKQGSTFTFTAQFGYQMEGKEERPSTPPDLCGLKVLVVDDNALAREVLEEQLKAFKFEVDTAYSGEEALRRLELASATKPYDLVLMDWKMPGLNGIECSKMIKENTKLAHMPLIIMVSAFGREEVMKRAQKSGVNAFLMKPVSQSLLFDTVMEVFGQEASVSTASKSAIKRETELTEKIKGAQVLLVEDNPINQQVAREILEGAALIVKVANNGKEAVEAVAKWVYDAVLMDVQMPVMGGFEATSLIRKDGKNQDLPIIAMTAHAMQGAREQCLEAGMNDYVTKPIDPEHLFDVLTHWIKPGLREEIPALQKAEDKKRSEKMDLVLPGKLPGLDIKAGIKRLGGNKKLFLKLLQEFNRDYANAAGEIRDALAHSDLNMAGRLAHTIKGVAGNFSAVNVFETALKLEKGIKDGNTDNLKGLLDDFSNALNLLLGSIRELNQKEDKTTKSVKKDILDFSAILLLLKELDRHIQENSLDAEEAFASLKEELGGESFSAEMQKLENHIEKFDFKNAREILTDLATKIESVEINS